MTRSLATTGIILRLAPLGESDRFVTFLTKEYGKITTIAKGIRTIKSRRNPHIELMNRVKFQFWKSRHHFYLTQAQTEETFRDLKSDITTLASALFLIEATERLTPDEHAEPLLYDFLNDTLELMNFTPHQHTELREAGLLKLLQQLGHVPTFRACGECTKRLPAQNAYLNQEQAILRCEPCTRKHPTASGQTITLDTLKLMHFLLETPLRGILKISDLATHLETLRHVGRTFLYRTLSQPLKSEKALNRYEFP